MSERQLTLAIDLGGEQVAIDRMELVEALGRPFVMTVDLFSSLGELDLLPHLGKPAAIALAEDDEFQRYFHGILTEGEYLSEQTAGYHYRLVLRPWTHFLSHNSDFAIFQSMSTLDIVQKVLGSSSFADIDLSRVTGRGRIREYCVQYGESDFAFLSRLFEEEGFYYYFQHDEKKHVMIVCDDPSCHKPGPVPHLVFNATAATVANSGSAMRGTSTPDHYVERWSERVVSGGESAATVHDFDFEKPQQPVRGQDEQKRIHPLDQIEVFEWPGRIVTPADATKVSKTILLSRRGDRQTYSGETQLTSLAVGTKVDLKQHPTGRFNRGYLVTRTHHVIAAETYASGQSGSMQTVHFEAIPDDVNWHPPRISPRPIVRGPETAIVTGPSGEEIFTDKYGRVKVRFHWDRGDAKDENSSCWIRVSQTGGLGNIILPRVGHEVLVDFLDGDPDRPLVVGRVFNAENMPIYQLPKEKTKALWRSKTYGSSGSTSGAKPLDTGSPGANEIRFEDMGGKEELFLHAQRDMKVRVVYQEDHRVGYQQTIDIGDSRDVKVHNSDALTVDKSIKIKAGTTIEIEAETSITFKVGQTKMVLDPTSLTVKTTQINMQAQGTADIKSPMTTVKGDGMLTLQGGLTKIN